MSKQKQTLTIDGNEAAARVAYQLNEVIAIYPITPSSPMGEWSDQWASEKRPNLWGTVPTVVEMQSEGGAAGAVHGALQAGSLTTTFTSSQGLLLMIPNMYKIAGELTATAFHVAARALAAQALSIFGDHSDVMATRATGFALLASELGPGSDRPGADRPRPPRWSRAIPFLHFFDGFRTSHEVAKIDGPDAGAAPRDDRRRHSCGRTGARALSPDQPVLRGTAQNPDVYFQAREAVNPYYLACPGIVQRAMDRFAEGRGPRVPPVRLRRGPRRRARHRPDGLGRRGGRGGGRTISSRKGEKVGVAQGPPVPAVLGPALRGRAAARPSRRSRCSTAPRSPAASASRSTWTWSPRWPRR